MRYHCGGCDYEGPCYGAPHSNGVSGPWCPKCGLNNQLTPLLIWREQECERVLSDRRRRSLQLFIVSVITSALCLVALYFMVSIWAVEQAKEPEAPQQQSLSLPQLCAPLYNRGLHRFWASCMGVGYDDTPIDRHLYANREDD